MRQVPEVPLRSDDNGRPRWFNDPPGLTVPNPDFIRLRSHRSSSALASSTPTSTFF